MSIRDFRYLPFWFLGQDLLLIAPVRGHRLLFTYLHKYLDMLTCTTVVADFVICFCFLLMLCGFVFASNVRQLGKNSIRIEKTCGK